MIKKVTISICLLFSLMSFAQSTTSSPYSFYGLGEMRFKGTLETRSMGGVAVVPDSIHLNLLNPASYSSLRLTTFSMGAGFSKRYYTTESQSDKAQRSTLDYLAVGLPLGKFGVGFGVQPFSSVGYKIQSISSDPTKGNKFYEGKGGLNSAFIGTGYSILPNLSVGLDFHYIFGATEKTSLLYLSDVANGTNEINEAIASGLEINLGAMHQYKLNEKLNLFTSITYTPKYTMSLEDARTISTVKPGNGDNLITIDSFDPILVNTDLPIAERWMFGIGFGDTKKWQFSTQITFQNLGSFANNYNTIENATYGKYSKYSFGGLYVPNSGIYSKYWQKITYRSGFKYEKTGLILNSESINDYSLSLGAGLPLNGFGSSVNFGIELGRKGTTDANLVREGYLNFNISFSFNDRWFKQSKID